MSNTYKNSISYAVTVCNEHEELKRLLDILDSNIKDIDEIIIQYDMGNITDEVLKVISEFKSNTKHYHSVISNCALNNNFAKFKNNLQDYCTKNYIFQLDADEYLTDDFFRIVNTVLEIQDGATDLYYFPRINIVNGITREYMIEREWNDSIIKSENESFNVINFPDLQGRLYKNSENIKWKGKVHERIDGHKSFAYLYNPEWIDDESVNLMNVSIIHVKEFDRQKRQNELYDRIEYQ